MLNITIEDVGKALGLSKSTVSRALSGKGRVSDETREMVKNYMRRQKVQDKGANKKSIGVVIPADAYTTSVPYFQECLLGISESAEAMQYYVLITTGVSNNVSNIKRLLESGLIEGIILLRNLNEDYVLEYLTEQKFPTALSGTCEFEDVIQVDTDNRKLSENMTSILINQKYNRFALVAGHSDYKVNQERINGFYTALDKNQMSRDDHPVYTDVQNIEYVDGIIDDLISRRVECVICADDIMCTRIMSCIQSKRLRIPKDISVASLINSENLRGFSPAVTAINIPAKQIGKVVGANLINYLEGNSINQKTVLDYEILLRKSTDSIYI